MKTPPPTSTKSSSSSKTNLLWVPLPWIKTSTPSHTKSPSFSSFLQQPLPFSSPSTPIHHTHSPSLKDIHTLLLNHSPTPPFSPLHKHSLPSSTPAQTQAQAQAQAHHSVSFKDIEYILSDHNNSNNSSPSLTQARKPSIFHRVKTWAHRQTHQAQQQPPNSSNKVVVYFTSLHVVRRTYEDCRAVRSILKGYNVKLDERDLSMDRNFLEELQKILIVGKKDKNVELSLSLSLPRVYVNGKYIGGVEEIRRLHESGELNKLIQGLPKGDENGSRRVCKECGGFRFIVCEWCDGSHRVFVDNEVMFKTCTYCNVNGLILCGSCTTVVF